MRWLVLPFVLCACSGGSFEVASSEDDASVADSSTNDAASDVATETCMPNACGGCTALPGNPLDRCGTCGVYRCDGKEALRCEEKPKNECGGCKDLAAKLGTPCPSCGGTVVCDGLDKVKCSGGTGAKNVCGGCTPLMGMPGDHCGTCGRLTCMGTDALTCVEGPKNDCGGCTTLSPKPKDPCGSCGAFVCNGTDSVTCKDPGKNDCGGCATLTHVRGTPCSTPDAPCGQWQCSPSSMDALVCAGGCAAGTSCCMSTIPPKCTPDACLSCCPMIMPGMGG